jgi:tubulin-specific chaperone A
MANNSSGNLTEKQQESARTIHASGSALLSLINEILDLSKIEAGKIELLIEPVAIKNVTTDLERLFREIAAHKGLQLNIDIDADLPDTITTDDQRLQQILRNLLTNACKFTHKGAVSLKVSRPEPEMLLITDLERMNSIAFAVQDNGIGIPQEKQAAIFEAFQQADGSTSRKYGGTGLGLSISRELAKLLGGTIHLKSEKDQGSTFTVIVPEQYHAAVIDAEAESPAVAGAAIEDTGVAAEAGCPVRRRPGRRWSGHEHSELYGRGKPQFPPKSAAGSSVSAWPHA